MGMVIEILEQKVEFDVEQLSHRILDGIFASDDCMTAGMSHLIELWVKSCGLFHNSCKREELCQMSAWGTLVRLWWGIVRKEYRNFNYCLNIVLELD